MHAGIVEERCSFTSTGVPDVVQADVADHAIIYKADAAYPTSNIIYGSIGFRPVCKSVQIARGNPDLK